MTRASAAPVTIALDPGVASWYLRRVLLRAGTALGTLPLDPVLPISRPFTAGEGSASLSAIRAAVETAVPRVEWLGYDLDGFTSAPGGTVGLAVRPSAPLATTSAAIDAALSGIANPAALPDERCIVPVARGLRGRLLREAMRILDLVRPPWYRRLFRTAGPGTLIAPPLRPLDAIRLLVLAGGRPVAGYDLATRRWLSRPELDDREKARSALRRYRIARGLELADPGAHRPGETWLLADLHLGHPGIALYASRPFLPSDTAEMDRVLVANWRATVGPEDRALLIGDLCAGPGPDRYREAGTALTGRVTLVRGNHDPDLPGVPRSVSFEACGHRFTAVHDPSDAPGDFDGWVLHGHLHNSDLRRFPFFNPVDRRINVSVETAGYRPVPLSLVCDLIASGSNRILTRESVPAPLSIPI